tara:strand:+ start:1683 stop:1856 length:174 start_codon:yes stop_codon:yes gene_type:complete
MEQNYSIEEILKAVSDLQNKKKETKLTVKQTKPVKESNIGIPKTTLKLIEEAERIKK